MAARGRRLHHRDGTRHGSMIIEISGLNGDRVLTDRVAHRMAGALRGLRVAPLDARILFVDDNGPKGGGARCAITVRVPYRPALHVEATGVVNRSAFDEALGALDRRLARYRERPLERRRRSKKYGVAK